MSAATELTGTPLLWSGKISERRQRSERQQALSQLENHQQTLTAISQRALNADKPALKLFGALLSKAFQFPDRQYVYLVDGRPVITFWGFVELDKRSRSDALACLRATLQPEPIDDEPLIAAPMPKVAPTPQPEPVITPPEPAPAAPRASAPVSAYQAITELSDDERESEDAPVDTAPPAAPAKRSRRLLGRSAAGAGGCRRAGGELLAASG